MKRRLQRTLWILAVLAVGLLVVKTFVFDVYHVDSGSMEPTLFGSEDGGEYVLVHYDRTPPERFELLVLKGTGTDNDGPVVKRAAGLPGESVQVSNGDLLVNGERLESHEPRPIPITTFDDRYQSVADSFRMGSSEMNPWTENQDSNTWQVDALDVPLNAQAGLMFLSPHLNDDYLDMQNQLVRGRVEQVNDAIIECEFSFPEAADKGRMRLVLYEQGDTFQVSIEPRGDGVADITLSRRSDAGSEEVLERDVIEDLEYGAWTKIRFSNVDNYLSVELGASGEVVGHAYGGNRPHSQDLQGFGKSYGHRLALGGEEARIRFRRIRILRDLYYTPTGNFGVDGPQPLGPEQIFVLGDNSAASRDGRIWGPVDLDEVVGRPVWVVWPPSRIRPVQAVREP